MPLRVIGAGLGRTGTLSLKTAFEQHLGFKRCYHMGEVSEAAHPLWIAAADGHPDWDRIFDGYDATTDYPACSFWRELADYYPDAKVLLSVRDPNKWFNSTQETIFSPELIAGMQSAPPSQREFIDKCVLAGFGDHIHDREFMVAHFNRHIEEVKRAIPKDRLLIFDVKEGWEPLCAFLGVPVPQEPFPHVNDAQSLKAWIQLMGEVQKAFPSLSFAEVSELMKATENRMADPTPSPAAIRERLFEQARELAARKA